MPKKKQSSELAEVEKIKKRIYTIRGQRVMLDKDLAKVYEVTTSRLNQQRERNPERFPEDFAFRLIDEEVKGVVTKSDNLKYSPHLPWAYTLKGANQMATVLKSLVATKRSVWIMRAFSQMEEYGLILPEGSDLVALETFSVQLQQQATAIVELVKHARKAELERKELRAKMNLIEEETRKTQKILSEIDRKAAISRLHQLGQIVAKLLGGDRTHYMKVWGGYRGKWGFKLNDTPLDRIEEAENDFILQIVDMIARHPDGARGLESHHISFLATYDVGT